MSGGILKYIDDVLEKYKTTIYIWLFVLPYVLYFITLLGFWYVNPTYIHTLGIVMQIYVALFLIFRFHPYRKHEIRPHDNEIILGSAFLLLANAGVTSYLVKLLNPINNIKLKS